MYVCMYVCVWLRLRRLVTLFLGRRVQIYLLTYLLTYELQRPDECASDISVSTSAKEFMFTPLSLCLSVHLMGLGSCQEQDINIYKTKTKARKNSASANGSSTVSTLPPKKIAVLLCHRPHRVGTLCNDGRCLSVCSMFVPKSSMEIGRREAPYMHHYLEHITG